jgi:hypothetical protein
MASNNRTGIQGDVEQKEGEVRRNLMLYDISQKFQ